jgi:hypothetical protein
MEEQDVLHALTWFEIPVTDILRAIQFYSTILEAELEAVEHNPGYPMATLPYRYGVGGALVQGQGYAPSTRGTIVYLNCGSDLDAILGRVEAAGGKILMPKTGSGETGYAAYILDTEGNKIGLHGRG